MAPRMPEAVRVSHRPVVAFSASHGRDGRGAPRILACADVPPLQGQSDDVEGASHRRGAGRGTAWARPIACPTAGASGRAAGSCATAEAVRDYIAGMTDRLPSTSRSPVRGWAGTAYEPVRRYARSAVRDALRGLMAEAGYRRASTCSASRSIRRAIRRFGEVATNAAMVLAKAAGQGPMDSRQLGRGIGASPGGGQAQPAPPGFVNLRMRPGFWQAQIPGCSRRAPTTAAAT